jgi:hypothetical protein
MFNIPQRQLPEKQDSFRRGQWYLQLKELTVGGGNSVFKVQNGKVFAGSAKYETAKFKIDPLTGTIYIAGNADVTGNVRFLSGTTERGRIYADSNGMYMTIGGKGFNIDTNGNAFVPNADLTVFNDITSTNGEITCYNDIRTTHGKIYCVGDITISDGGVTSNNGLYSPNGSVLVKYNIEAETGYVKAGDWITARNNITSEVGGFIALDGNFASTDGNFYTTNGYMAAGDKFICDSQDGVTGTYDPASGNKIRFTGGIATDLNY